LDSGNVRVGVTGAISMAPVAAPEPQDSDSRLTEPCADLGYVSEDGVTEARERSTEQQRAWQNAAVVHESVTEATLTYQFTLIETKRETVELYYGDTADPGDGSIPIIPAKTGGRTGLRQRAARGLPGHLDRLPRPTRVPCQEVLLQPCRRPAANRRS
jgi:hypothetical protein